MGTDALKALFLGLLCITSPICLVYGLGTGHAVFIGKGIVVIEHATHPGFYLAVMAVHLVISLGFLRWLYRASTSRDDA